MRARTLGVGAALAASVWYGGAAGAAHAEATPEPSGDALSLEEARELCPEVSYYTVEDSSDGLFAVAERTLDDKLRASDIYQLNEGRTQPEGGELGSERDLEPGWQLVLPSDASGDGVSSGSDPLCVAKAEEAAEAGDPIPSPEATPEESPDTSPSEAASEDDSDEPPVDPKLLGGAAAGLLLLTGLALWWQPVFRTVAWPFVAVARLGWRKPRWPLPVRLLQARRRRQRVAQRVAEGEGEQRRAGVAVLELQAAPATVAARPAAVWTAPEDLQVVVPADATLPASSWRSVDATTWQQVAGRSATSAVPFTTTTSQSAVRPRTELLTSVGADSDWRLFVDLSRLDGVLLVTGHRSTAGDTVRVLAEGLAGRGAKVTVLSGSQGIARIQQNAPQPVPEESSGPITGPGGPPGKRRFVAVPRVLTASEREVLAELPDGVVVLAVGESPHAHWQWRAHESGWVDTGALGASVVVPIPTERS